MQVGKIGGHPCLDRSRRRLCCHAVKIGSRRSRSGRCVWNLAGGCGGNLDGIEINLEFMRHDLRHFCIQPLAHFGAAMVQMNGPVGIYMHQRTRLIQKGGVEGNTKLHWRQGNAALDHRAVGIEGCNRGAALVIFRIISQLLDNILKNTILDRLPVRCHTMTVGGVMRIKIAAAHLKRVELHFMRDRIDHPFNSQHALWPAKPAKGGIRLRMGLAAMRNHTHVRHIIGIVSMAHGTCGDRFGQVPRHAAAQRLFELGTANSPVRIKADMIINPHIMPFAGQHEIIIAVIDCLGRPACRLHRQRRQDGGQIALAFLAAKAATHATCFNRHRIIGKTQRIRHLVLNFGRVLGGTIYRDVSILGRHSQRGLSLKIEMFLTTNINAP